MERVSIIIATHNAEKYIRRALDSVLKQQNITFECLVIDGKSTDSTVDILRSYEDKITYISEKDKGIFDALNKGVRMAQYEWIYILGADDELISSTSLADLLSGDDVNDKDVVYGNIMVRYPDGTLIQNHSKHYSLVRRCMFACHQGIIMKRRCILELGGFSLKYPLCADFDLIQRAYLNGYKFKQTQVFVAYYFSKGVSSQNLYRNLISSYYVLKKNRSVRYPFLIFTYSLLRGSLRNFVYKVLIGLKIIGKK